MLNQCLQAYKAGYIMPNQYKPDLVGAPNSMSPHLRFGCLSIRKFYWELHDIFAKVFGWTTQFGWKAYKFYFTLKLSKDYVKT